MIIKSLRVQNFRSIRDATLRCEPLTALVGANGSGKSSFLHALDIFYDPGADYTEDDFHARSTKEPISIAVTFTDLSAEEEQRFAPYLDNGDLTVEKVLTYPRGRVSQKYYGTRAINPDFHAIHSASAARDKLSLYRDLRATPEYEDLPTCRSGEDVKSALADWEAGHRDRLKPLRDDGQFFGFKEVGEAKLERDTRFILVRAVRDASEEASEAKGAALGPLMDLVVRATLSQREDIASFRESVQERYEELMDPENLPELKRLESTLTTTLDHFAPGTAVALDWQEQTMDMPTPRALPELIEDGFQAPVSRTGHGSQRAFILTLLQHLEGAQPTPAEQSQGEEAGPSERRSLPGLILAIEEPELYQHPSRQRHLATVLRGLAEGTIPGVARRTQIIYSTHSPLFVGLDRFDQIRILRKVASDDDLPKETLVRACTLAQVTADLQSSRDPGAKPLSEERVQAGLRTLMTAQTNEAFFAKAVALLEGPDDYALFLSYVRARGISLDATDVCLVCCNGKGAMPAALAVFLGLSIPAYPVFDADKGDPNAPKLNRQLLRLLGLQEEEYPSGVCDAYAAFPSRLPSSVLAETQGELEQEVKAWARHNDVREKDAWRNQACLDGSFSACLSRGTECSSLGQICERLVTLAEEAV